MSLFLVWKGKEEEKLGGSAGEQAKAGQTTATCTTPTLAAVMAW